MVSWSGWAFVGCVSASSKRSKYSAAEITVGRSASSPFTSARIALPRFTVPRLSTMNMAPGPAARDASIRACASAKAEDTLPQGLRGARPVA